LRTAGSPQQRGLAICQSRPENLAPALGTTPLRKRSGLLSDGISPLDRAQRRGLASNLSEEVCPFISPSLRIKLQHLERHLSARGLAFYRLDSSRAVSPRAPTEAVRPEMVWTIVADRRSDTNRSGHAAKRSGPLSGGEPWRAPSEEVSAKRSGLLSHIGKVSSGRSEEVCPFVSPVPLSVPP
jgi:ribosome modulation factor